MREVVLIASSSEHACGQPSIERWHVFEPISGRWSWIRVFSCCKQVFVEAEERDEERERKIKRAA
jgi:hypothetical protein